MMTMINTNVSYVRYPAVNGNILQATVEINVDGVCDVKGNINMNGRWSTLARTSNVLQHYTVLWVKLRYHGKQH